MFSCHSVPRYRAVKRRTPVARQLSAPPVLPAQPWHIPIPPFRLSRRGLDEGGTSDLSIPTSVIAEMPDEPILAPAAQREKSEPIARREPISLLLLTVC